MDTSHAVAYALEALLGGTVLGLVYQFLRGSEIPAGELRYSKRWKWGVPMGAAFVAGALGLLLYNDPKPIPDGVKPLYTVLAVGFGSLFAATFVELFGIRHTYNDHTWNFHSPWSPHRALAWSQVERVSWTLTGYLVFHGPPELRPLRASIYFSGVTHFAQTAVARVQPAILQRDPQGYAMLKIIAAGHVGDLMSGHADVKALERTADAELAQLKRA